MLLADFDAPGSTSTDPKAISLPLEYLPAPGDSGGGLFATFGEQTKLVGVTSFLVGITDGTANASYTDVAAWTRVSSYYDWIYSIVPLSITPLAGDLNFDGAVDIFDINIVSAHWGQSGPDGDANSDGIVERVRRELHQLALDRRQRRRSGCRRRNRGAGTGRLCAAWPRDGRLVAGAASGAEGGTP